MKPKKAKKAQLENKKGLYIQVGLVIALSLVLISFEWTSAPQVMDKLNMVNDIEILEDIIITRRVDPPKEEIKPKAPPVEIVLEIVEDDEADSEGYDIDMEVDGNTGIDIADYINPAEYIPEPVIFIVVEEMPTFNGGDPKVEFRKYIGKNVNYPAIPAANGVSGRVQVEFVVNSSGKVVNAVITRSVDPELDKEALRVVESSPLWEPGKQRGKEVNVLYSFPITFRLR